jgi:hypothetical protein
MPNGTGQRVFFAMGGALNGTDQQYWKLFLAESKNVTGQVELFLYKRKPLKRQVSEIFFPGKGRGTQEGVWEGGKNVVIRMTKRFPKAQMFLLCSNQGNKDMTNNLWSIDTSIHVVNHAGLEPRNVFIIYCILWLTSNVFCLLFSSFSSSSVFSCLALASRAACASNGLADTKPSH